jgi:hypothetical protein
MGRFKKLLVPIILLLAIGSVSACKENKTSSDIISDAIDGKLERKAYWLLMSSAATNSGWEKVILVSGFWDNYEACEELKIWGKSNPLRAGRKFRCELVR